MRHILLILLLGTICKSSGPYTLVLSGQMENAEKQQIYLIDPIGREIDSTTISNNSFAFKLDVPEADYYNLKLKNSNAQFRFLADAESISISADARSFRKARISGSPGMDFDRRLRKSYHSVAELQNAAFDSVFAAMDRKDFIAALKFEKLNVQYTDQINDSVARFIKTHPRSHLSLFRLEELAKVFPLERSRKLYENLHPDLKKHTAGKRLRYKLFEASAKLQKGNTAPVVSGISPDGKPVNLPDLKGRYVLIDFWASWCEPCRKEFPELRELYEKFHPAGFEILGVSLDTKPTLWKKAIVAEKLVWKNISEGRGFKGDIAIRYNVTEIPMNYLLNKDGTIIGVNLHNKELADLLSSLLTNGH